MHPLLLLQARRLLALLCAALTLFSFTTADADAAPWTPADLGDRVWLDWWAEDAAEGDVPLWASRQGKQEATPPADGKAPAREKDAIVFEAGERLNFRLQGNAHLAHRALVILFRIDLKGSGTGSIFGINGIGGGIAERQPYVGYDREKDLVIVSWRTPSGSNSITFKVAEDATQWHCLVSRRVDTPSGPVHYASLDGRQADGATSGETAVPMADWALMKTNAPVVSWIGDHRSNAPAMAIDSILLLQDNLSAEDAQRLMGWGMWRRGLQARLPDQHAFRRQAPVSSAPPKPFAESTQEQFDALKAFWKDTSQSEVRKGAKFDLTGWVLAFEDNFDSHTVTNDVTGRGKWFAPTHGAPCGAATAIVPPGNKTDAAVGTEGAPSTYIHKDSTMTIRMQKTGTRWTSGAFCSVNSNGFGRTWMYPAVEARMKASPSTTGNRKGAWPALWMKSVNGFYNLAQSYVEYDIYEGYVSDPKGYHNSYHNWPASRKLPGRLQKHRHMSNYLGLKTPGWHEHVDLFDGEYHTYGVMVRPDVVITMFDGKEIFRFPTPLELKQPLWLLVDLALGGAKTEPAQADGVYDLTIDYIKVYQHPQLSPQQK